MKRLLALVAAAAVVLLAGCDLIIEPTLPRPTLVVAYDGRPNENALFLYVADDEVSESVSYQIEFGDGTNRPWTEFRPIRTWVTDTHTYTQLGLYGVRVRARNEQGELTNWSLQLPFKVSEAGRPKTPDFTIPDLDSNLVHLYGIVGGKLTCLVWWDLDAPYSIEQLDEMQPMYDTIAPRGFQLLAITRSGPEREQEVRDFAAAKGWTFPVLLDSTRVTTWPYHAIYIPTSHLIAADTGSAYHGERWDDYQRVCLTEFIRFYMPE